LLRPLAEAGVDLFDASQRHFAQPAFDGSPLNLAGWAKKLTGVPAMTVGGVGMATPRDEYRVERPMEAEDNSTEVAARLAAGEFDLVAVGRALLNDPEWLARLRDRRPSLPFDRANLARLT
jgi:2,4-dienoyl-CoA reductase-like NADH-dependent reductase (Old Yellow Enzyme family)